MPFSFIVLSEVPLRAADAMRALEYLGLGPEAESAPRVRAVVPADIEHSVVAEVIDSLGLLDLRAAYDAIAERVRGERTADAARHDASDVLASVEGAFRAAGCEVSGTVVDEDPIPALRASLEEGCDSGAVVVFSDPQLLEETFAQDWAHKVEDHLEVTVLHLYPGSDRIGTA